MKQPSPIVSSSCFMTSKCSIFECFNEMTSDSIRSIELNLQINNSVEMVVKKSARKNILGCDNTEVTFICTSIQKQLIELACCNSCLFINRKSFL